MATWEDVRRIALALPGTSEATSRGTSTWVVGRKLFAWERPLRRADLAALGDRAPGGPILGVFTGDLELKETLLAAERAAFTTPHFDGYAAILIDLPAIDSLRLEPIIIEGWLARAPQRVRAAYMHEYSRGADKSAGASAAVPVDAAAGNAAPVNAVSVDAAAGNGARRPDPTQPPPRARTRGASPRKTPQ